MQKLKQFALVSVLVPVLVFQAACSASESTVALGVAQIAVSTVVAALSISGQIPPQFQPAIATWASEATTAFAETATELQSSDTSAQKSLKVSGYWTATFAAFATIAPGAVPYVSLAESDIQAFLNIVAPAGAVANASGGVKAHGITAPAQIKLSFSDRRKLAEIKSKAALDQAKLAGLPKK